MKNNKNEILTTANEIFKFITDEYLQKRILLQCFVDTEFNATVLELIQQLNKKIKAETINTIFTNLHEKTVMHLKLAQKNSLPTRSIGNHVLLSLSYFYLLEAFDEHCKLNDKTLRELQKMYGSNYLNTIALVDQIYLSDDIQKIQATKKTDDLLSIENVECLKKYILFKEWQDKQHHFYYNTLEKFSFSYLKQCYAEFSEKEDLENAILTKIVLERISKKKIVDIEIISLLVNLDMKKEALSLFGGKSYGLAKLKTIGATIPWTVIIPIGKNITYEEIDANIPQEIRFFSVRSSADIEDGENYSFAGMFDSYLNVERKMLIENIKKVKDSVKNARLKSYIKKNNLEKPHMAVIIQEFIEPQLSGVWMGNNLTSGLLEYTEGNGEKLVSGKVIPKNEFFKNSMNELNNCLTINGNSVGKQLTNMQKKLKTISDFEWMVLNDKLVMLQFRPVTVKVKKQLRKTKSVSNHTIKGLACSSGKVEGKIQFLNSPTEKFKTGNILLAWVTDPDWIPHMMKAKGVITASGGFLCHAGIVSRELGIPCITGVGGEVVKKLSLQDELEVVLDGDEGTITIK